MIVAMTPIAMVAGSLPTRGGWIEIASESAILLVMSASLPTRGGWIEIVHRAGQPPREVGVPPHTGRVD